MTENQFVPITEEDAEIAQSLTMSSRPTMEPEPEMAFSLPGGYIDPHTGELHRNVEVRELNGRDEEIISAASRSKNYIDFLDKIITNNVTSIGGHEVTKDVVHSLTTGDRQYLLMAIRQASFGDKLDLEWRCPNGCNEPNTDVVKISEIPVKRVDSTVFDTTVVIGKGKPDAVVTMRLVNGGDSWVMSDQGLDDRALMNTFILARCLVKWDGALMSEKAISPTKFVQDMPLRIRNQLIEALLENQPGPDYSEVTASCQTCGEVSPIRFDMASLLLG